MEWVNQMTEQSQEAVIFVLLIAGTYVLASVIRASFNRFVDINTKVLGNDPTNYKFIGHVLIAIVYTVGIGLAINKLHPLKPVASSMLAGAGIAAIAVGFASQQALSNIISGIFIIIFKPFRVNDALKLKNEYSGVVEDITLRHTVLRDAENRRVVIPNSIINAEIIINTDYDDDTICKFIEVPVPHRTDLEMVKQILQEEVRSHPNFLDKRTKSEQIESVPPVTVKVIALNSNSVTLRAYAWAKDNARAFDMYCDILEQIKKRFDREGLNFPDKAD